VAAFSVDTGVSEPTVPMDTANSGEVTVSGSLVVKKSLVLAKSNNSAPTAAIGTEGTVSGFQLSEVQTAAGGRKKLSVVPHRKQLFVSRFTPDTTSVYSYIPLGSDLIIYEHHLSAIKSVLYLFSNRDLLIVLRDFNLLDISWSPPTDSLVAIPLSVHDFEDGLLEVSLQQVDN